MEESLKIFHNKDLTPDEAMLKVTERLAHIGSWQMDLKTGEGKWSDETFRMIGYNPGEVPPLFESMLKQVHPDDLEYVKKAVEEVRTNNLSSQKINHRIINHATKQVRYLETELVIDKDDNGEPLHAMGFNFDVTSRKLTEEKLKQSEARLLASQQIAHIGCWEVLLSGNDSFLGKHEFWSLEKYRILGLDPELVEPNGTNLLQTIHPDDRDLLIKKFNDAILYKRLYNFDHRIIRPDGIERIVHERGEVIKDKLGNPLKMIGTIQDITDRAIEEEALRESEANLRTVFDNTTTVFILVDSDLKIVSFNKGALDGLSKELGQTLEIGKEMIGIIDEHKKQRTLDMYKRVFEGEKFKLEDYYTLKDGKVLWYEMQLLPVKVNAGKINHMIVYLSDITKRKIVEIEKEKITTDLLERNKDLEQFSYIISHNLRLPIANIIGLVDNLTLNNFQGEEKKDAMSAIHISARKLDDVVMDLNKILDVRTKDNEHKQMLELSGILFDTQINLGSIIRKENALIESDFSEINELFTVKSYISSIFYNLVLNSIKYRRATLTPHINIKSKLVDGKIQITFQDNGLGMDIPRRSEELFGLYKRFHPHINGKGVGLYMV